MEFAFEIADLFSRIKEERPLGSLGQTLKVVIKLDHNGIGSECTNLYRAVEVRCKGKEVTIGSTAAGGRIMLTYIIAILDERVRTGFARLWVGVRVTGWQSWNTSSQVEG
jgi:hypothetical protein